jgi:hypothetical protein
MKLAELSVVCSECNSTRRGAPSTTHRLELTMNKVTYGEWVPVAPYSEASCRYFCHATGKCAKGITPPPIRTKRSAYWEILYSCGEYCPSWDPDDYHSEYFYSSYGSAWVLVDHKAFEYLGTRPFNGGLYAGKPGDIATYHAWLHPGESCIEFQQQLMQNTLA